MPCDFRHDKMYILAPMHYGTRVSGVQTLNYWRERVCSSVQSTHCLRRSVQSMHCLTQAPPMKERVGGVGTRIAKAIYCTLFLNIL